MTPARTAPTPAAVDDARSALGELAPDAGTRYPVAFGMLADAVVAAAAALDAGDPGVARRALSTGLAVRVAVSSGAGVAA